MSGHTDLHAIRMVPDHSRTIREWMNYKEVARARTSVSVRPEAQTKFEPFFSYIVYPGVREWFFTSAAIRDEFVERHQGEATAYP